MGNTHKIKNYPWINISWQSQRLLLLCQTRLIPCIQMCSSAPRSHLHPSHGGGFSRQGSLFYPSVNQHPQADSPGSSCQTTQHLPPHCFATNARPSPGPVPRISPQDYQESSMKHLALEPSIKALHCYYIIIYIIYWFLFV